jgi:hypothetical protein
MRKRIGLSFWGICEDWGKSQEGESWLTAVGLEIYKEVYFGLISRGAVLSISATWMHNSP